MRKRSITMLFASVSLFCVLGLAQDPPPPGPAPEQSANRIDQKVTYGRVKEFTAGQKLAIDIDNAPDKNYDLTDTNITYKVARDLKVGDSVMITESEVSGKKTIEVAKHSGAVKPGDSDRKKQ
jgi:hypothetical protein